MANPGTPETAKPASRYRIEDPEQFEQHMSALLGLHANEVQMVWSRYNALLTGNAIAGAFLAAFLAVRPESPADVTPRLLASFFGLALSLVWFLITKHGWDLSAAWYWEIREYAAANQRPDPFRPFADWNRSTGREDKKDWIRITAELGIWLFILLYSVICFWQFVELGYLMTSPGLP